MFTYRSIKALAFLSTLFSAIHAVDWPVNDSGYTHSVQWDHYSFFINGERQFLFGGEMHPFRIPVPEMWEDIFQKIKAAGMNTMSFYSMWGMHESYAGELDFTSASRDLDRLLRYAEDAGLYVMARPGPYVNGELSAGGFPLWLTTGEYGSTLRSNGSAYTEAWNEYMTKVSKLVADHQIHRNGTVITFQVENEYPSQWSNRTAKIANPKAVDYMTDLETLIRASGVEVPTTHNAPGRYPDWSSDFDTVNSGGDVNVWGQDSYPLCWSCNPDDCSSANEDFVLLEYYDFFQSVAPSQPGLMPEFQGGRVTPLGASTCADTVGPDFRNIYYRHNIDQKISALMLYMLAGGTNWGWIGVPFIGSSYDYSAPIAEDRTLRDSWYETKTLALFTRVAKDLRKVNRLNSTSTDNDAVAAIELRNPDTNAAFYVVRHATSTSDSSETFHLNVSTSIGNLSIPQILDGSLLNGHISKIIVTDFSFANRTLVYSTAEVLTFAIIEEAPILALWVPSSESGEFLLKDASGGRVLKCDGCSDVRFTQTKDGVIVTFVQGVGASVLQVGDVRVLLLDRTAAWKTFVPALVADPSVPEDKTTCVIDSVYVNGDLVGYFPGSLDATSFGLTVSFANVTIEDNGDNVILLIQDNTGHDEGSSALRPRGILNATLLGSNETIQWKLAGTAGAPTNTTLDSVRGPYNEGGLVSERLGWHLPGFDDSRWSDRSPSDGVAEATVQFYRTSLILDVPEQHDVSIVFTISSNATSEVRALLFVNGYQYGRYMPFVGSTSRFPVLPGILNYDGENIIAVSVWSQNPAGASLEVDWEVTMITRSSLDTKFDGSYLRPGWTPDRNNYG